MEHPLYKTYLVRQCTLTSLHTCSSFKQLLLESRILRKLSPWGRSSMSEQQLEALSYLLLFRYPVGLFIVRDSSVSFGVRSYNPQRINLISNI